jgi:hypothetical protein
MPTKSEQIDAAVKSYWKEATKGYAWGDFDVGRSAYEAWKLAEYDCQPETVCELLLTACAEIEHLRSRCECYRAALLILSECHGSANFVFSQMKDLKEPTQSKEDHVEAEVECTSEPRDSQAHSPPSEAAG